MLVTNLYNSFHKELEIFNLCIFVRITVLKLTNCFNLYYRCTGLSEKKTKPY